jgi:Ricin-type beta-trefoil lectin domain/Domain of unknown function (DUF5122) beta-propeller
MRIRLFSALAACAATAAVAGMVAPASAATQATPARGVGAALAAADQMVAAAVQNAEHKQTAAPHHSASKPASAGSVQAANVSPATTSPSGSALPALVSPTTASYTPNASAPGACNTTWLGSTCDSIVNDIAVVNGEAVVVGAFTQACAPGSSGGCASGTTVTRNDIFAYNVATGAIDPDFAPTLNQGPVYSVVAGPDNTVYIGGDFTTVDGANDSGVAQLSVTPGSSTDGQVVSAFSAQVTGAANLAGVNSLAVGGTALYIGGQFTAVDGAKINELARLNATTGARDTSFGITVSNPASGTTLQVNTVALSPSGSTLAVGGSFLDVNGESQPRLALINTGGGLGQTASLANWQAPLFANSCSKQHNYVEGIDYAPNGSFFVVGDTGFRSDTSALGVAPCDAAIRFNTNTSGTDVQPAWMNYTGGDSIHSVAATNALVYVGGHQRWQNNQCGLNTQCERNSVLINGIAAVDANTGLELPWWTPGTGRGSGVSAITPVAPSTGFGGGLFIGTDADIIGGTYHAEEALFPLTTTTPPVTGGPIPSGMFNEGRLDGADESSAGTAEMCLDDANDAAVNGNKIQFWQCLGDASQNWASGSDGSIRVNGMCLSVAGSWGVGKVPTNGTKVQLWACNGSASQDWRQGSGNTMLNGLGSKCLDDPSAGTKNGTQLQVWSCNGGAQQVWPLPLAQASPPPPATGTLNSEQIDSLDSVLCADDTGDATSSGSPVLGEECTESPEQNWIMQSNGTYTINGLCLDTQNGGTASGTSVVIDTCSGASSQVWEVSLHELINKASNECLTLPSATTGTALEITSCSGSVAQTWWEPEV